MKTLDAARGYLAKLQPAISGAGGHDATFRAACWLVRLGLDDADAMALLREWNGTHCQPPWTEKELAHKLTDARRVVGCRFLPLTAKPAVRVTWKIERKTPKSSAACAPDVSEHCPPGVADDLRHQRPDLPADLEVKTSALADLEPKTYDPKPDEAPWLLVADQVMAGEWDGGDRSTIEALTIGLRGINHPLCRKALARLPDNPKKRRSFDR